VVVVSELMAESVVAAGIPRAKVRLLRYGVDSTQFKSRTRPPRQPVFLGVGRFVDKKAPNVTVMAFKEVHRRFPNSRLVLAGDGLLLESTQNLAAALGLGGAIEFPGTLTTDEVAERMGAATAFVQHSLTPQVGPSAGDCEGTPVAVLEAMMSGLPVVATRHAGIGEVIDHGRNGFLVEERDVQAMSNAMIRLAASPETSEWMGRAARKDAMELYCAETYTENLQRILESAARRDDPVGRGEEVVAMAENHGLAESCRAVR
jgi:glycosyltransferase involved in cell wall biosynthesis